MAVIRNHRTYRNIPTPARRLAAAMLAAGLLAAAGCSSGNKANTGSGPNLLRAVILQPAQDAVVTAGTKAAPAVVNFSGTHTGGNVPDGTTPGYTWQWAENNVDPRLTDGQTLTVNFDDDDVGTYVFTFIVRDLDGYTASASVKVTVTRARF